MAEKQRMFIDAVTSKSCGLKPTSKAERRASCWRR